MKVDLFRLGHKYQRVGAIRRFTVLFITITSVIAPSFASAASSDPFRTGRDAVSPKQAVSVAQSSGAMTYSYPFAIPPGRNGMQPDISLNYSSADKRTDSVFGYGWSMNLPYIERINKLGTNNLYNQDRNHTFFTSSLSGELLTVKSTIPIGGGFLGVSQSTAPLALLDIPSAIMSYFGAASDAATSDLSNNVEPVPQVKDATVASFHTFKDTFAPIHIYHSDEEAEFNRLREQATQDAKVPRAGFPKAEGSVPQASDTQVDNPTNKEQQPIIGTPENPVWVYSQEKIKYDTADGELHPGEYALQPDGVTYIAYMPTSTVTTATSTYELPAYLSDFSKSSDELQKMTEVYDVGRIYVDAFNDGSSTINMPSSKDAYMNLDRLTPIAPTYSQPLTLVSLLKKLSPSNLLSILMKGIFGLKEAIAAITFDNANSYATCGSGTSCTYSYTVTGSNTFLVCNTSSYTNSPGAVTMSYGGSGMTEIGSQQVDNTASNNFNVDTYYLKGAATGANNLVITTTNSISGFYAHCASYTGVDQTSPIDTSTQHITNYATCSSDNTSITTTVDNDWVVGVWGDDAGRTHTAGAGTLRTTDSQGVIIDTGPKTPTGSATVTNIPSAATGCTATGFGIKPNTVTISATQLQVEALTNPTNVSNTSPSFSAVYTNSTSSPPLATSYELQVSTSATFATTYWDSAQQTLSSSTPSGQRTPLIYSTTTFPTDGKTYYWRIKFWDSTGQAGSWSTSGDYFTMQVAGDYMAKVDDGTFMRYTLGSDGSWTAYDKRGWKYTFGATSNARIYDSATTSSIYRWYLEEVADPNGNKILYRYTKDGGQVYPNYIDYTDHSGGSLGEIAFTKDFCDSTGSPCAPFATSSMYGFPVFTRYLISDITAAVNGPVVHRYTPIYTTGDNQSRVLLAGIQEKGYSDGNGTGPLSFPRTTFGYQTSTTTWTEVTDTNSYQVNFDITNTANDDKGYRLFDVNGDGLPDWVQSDGTTKAIRFNIGKAWGSASSTWSVPLSFSVSNAEQGVRTVDVNGDGLVDLIAASSTKAVHLNNGSNGWTASTSWVFPESFIDGSNNDQGVQIVDVNGDGLPDVFRAFYTTAAGTTTKVYINNGYTWTQDLGWSIPQVLISDAHDTSVRLYDYNGDGLVDIIYAPYPYSSANNRVYYNTGHGWQLDSSVTVPFAFADPTASIGTADRGDRFADLNGDGCVDIAQGMTSLTKDIRLSNCGTGWSGVVTNTLPEYFRDSASDYGVRMDDVNGDGQIDMVRGYFDSTGSTHTQKVYLKNGVSPDLLKQIVNSKGGKTTVGYQSSARYFDTSGNPVNSSVPFIVQTAHTITTDNGSFLSSQRMIATTTYDYQRGYYYASSADPYSRQFTGFGLVIEEKPSGAGTKTYFHQGNSSDSTNGEYNDRISKAGRPYRIEVLDATTTSANLYARTINKWARADYGDGRNFVKLVNSLTQTFDGDSTHRDTAASSTYDDLTGNLNIQESLGEVTGNSDGTWSDTGSDNATTTYTYAASSSLTAMLLPSRELVVNQSGATVKDTKFYYDNLSLNSVTFGNQTKQESLISGSTYASTTKIYDTYGNVATSTDPRGNASAFTYDGYHLFPITITNALSQQKLVSYDYSSGKAATTTDENNQTVVAVFDNLDRPILEKIPDFSTPSTLVTKSTYAYTDSTTTVSSVFKSDSVSSATSTDGYVYTDGFGRTIQAKSEAETANGWTTKDALYNSIGAIASDSLPYFAASSAWAAPTATAALYSNFYYDPIGRTTTVTDAIGTSKSAYSDWKTTVTDPLNNKKDYIKDAYGNLAQTIEYTSPSVSATSTYTWNRLGKLTKLTDAAANIRNFSYDILGRLTKSEDLHTSGDTTFGSSTYAYDVANNLTTLVTPNNQTINYAYDALNRVTSEDYTGAAGTEMTYTYDTATNGVGRLAQSAFQNNATTTYSYNPLGLLTTEAKRIGSGAGTWGTTTTSYLRNGAANIIIYPDASQVGYVYDDAGLLESVLAKEPSIATTSVITSLTYSPTGQTAIIKYANGVTATSTFDQAQKYRLTNRSSKGSALLQNIGYTYDSVGNITQISDVASSSARKSVNYGYDSLYRLLTASTTAVATGTSAYSQAFTYDILGNMLTGPSGTYTYGGTGYANPDAVTAIVSTGSGGSATISLDGTVATSTSTGNFTKTIVVGNNSDRLLLVAFATHQGGGDATAMTYNGVSLTESKSQVGSYGETASLWVLVAPATGSHTLSVTAPSNDFNSIGVYSLYGVKQSNPSITAGTSGSNSTASLSITPTSNNNWVIDSVEAEPVPTVGSGQTQDWLIQGSSSYMNGGGSHVAQTTAQSQTMQWSLSYGARWNQVAVALAPSGSGSATTTYTYDNAGNLTGSGLTTYAFDYHNRIASTSVAGGVITYLYDASGNRVSMVDPTSTTTRFWGSLYQDTLGAYKKTKNIYAAGMLVATLEKTGSGTMIPYYVLSDYQGSPTIMTNSSGVATETIDYLPYGQARVDAKAAGVNQSRKYIGQVYDDATSLSYLQARYYSGGNGKFLSQDPIIRGAPNPKILLNPQALNYYAYSLNNPINRSDPSGLFAIMSGPGINRGIIESGDTFSGIRVQINSTFGLSYTNSTLQAANSYVTDINKIYAGNYINWANPNNPPYVAPTAMSTPVVAPQKGFGYGGVVGATAEAGASAIGGSSMGSNVSYGSGAFVTVPQFQATKGDFVAAGSVNSTSLNLGPNQNSNGSVTGGFLGAGYGAYVTNAANSKSLEGVGMTRSLNVAFDVGLSFQVTTTEEGIWIASVSSIGPGYGASYSAYQTNTAIIK